MATGRNINSHTVMIISVTTVTSKHLQVRCFQDIVDYRRESYSYRDGLLPNVTVMA